MKELHIFTDGGARGNPGPAAVGVVIKDSIGGTIHRFGKYIGETTNNTAEYQAIVEALTWVKQWRKVDRIRFFVDSQLIALQLSGLYKVKKAHLQDLVFQVRALEQEIGANISYTAVPREQNSEADRFVNLALDKRGDVS